MEDKRITKTKRNIKATFTALLQEMPFEKIAVAEICRRGDISRITFYAHYEDKYALASEIFSEHIREVRNKYYTLQEKTNPNGDEILGYKNLLEAVLSLYFDHFSFFSHTTSKENPYLYSVYYHQMYLTVEEYLRRHPSLKPRFPTHQTAALICNGLTGVINSSVVDGLPEADVRRMAHEVYSALLRSDMFQQG